MEEITFLKNLFPKLKSDDKVVIKPGDDCAAISWKNSTLQLIAVDQVVAEQHFLTSTDSKRVGRKLLARNLSDIAAMGGTPLYALCTSAADNTFNQSYHEEFMNGIIELADAHDTQIIGGDVCGNPKGFVATLTIIGEVEKDKVVKRDGSEAGDFLFATGTFGDSFHTEHHLDFLPRLKEGKWLADNHYAKAMLDISDGILLDSMRLVKAGHNVSLQLFTKQIPARTEHLPIKNILTDGEDYELLFSVSKEKAEQLKKEWPFSTPLTCIGRFYEKSEQVEIINEEQVDLNKLFNTFSHFEK